MNKLSFEEWFKDLNKNCISNIFSNGCDTEKCSECDNGTSARQAWNFCQKQNDEEIEKLKEQIEKMKECLEFYARVSNWESIVGHTKFMSNLKVEDCAFFNCGGGRARLILEEMKNHFNCGAFRMSGKGHSEVACLEMVGCPCDKWKLKE